MCYEPSVCNQICNKANSNCPFEHLCKKPCSVACNSCIHPIPIVLNCGHISEFLCSQETDSLECTECKVKIKQTSEVHKNLVPAITKDANKCHDQVCKHFHVKNNGN